MNEDQFSRLVALLLSIVVVGACAGMGFDAAGWLGAVLAGVGIPTGGMALYAVASVLSAGELSVVKAKTPEPEETPTDE